MSGGPFRESRPPEREVAPRPEPQQAREEPRLVNRPVAAHRVMEDEKTWKKFIVPIVIVLFVIILAVVAWFVWLKPQAVATEIDSAKYQAIFLSNGQTYFGKLKLLSGGNFSLTDVYYLESQETTTSSDSKTTTSSQTTSSSSSPQLIKLGSELHGPEDEMVIAKDQVLFYENLKSDGKVTQAISKYKDSN